MSKLKRTKLHKKKKKQEIYLPYDILIIIFQMLNGRDRSNAAMVCTSWWKAADAVKYSLRRPYEFECFLRRAHIKYFLRKKENFKAIRMGMLCSIYDAVPDIPIIPFIAFVPIAWSKRFFISAGPDIYKSFPKNCKTIMLNGMNAFNNKRYNPKCIILPKISNIKINTIKITNKINSEKLIRKLYMQISKKACRQNHERSTCLILFCNYNGYDTATLIASLAYHDKKIASLWGGMTRMLYSSGRSNIAPNVLAVLITGSIQTWSIVVNGRRKMYEQVQEELNLFKEQVKLQKHSLGFMFASLSCKKRSVKRVRNLLINIFPKLNNVLHLVNRHGGHNNKIFGKDTIVDREKFKNLSDQLLRNDSIPPWTNTLPLISIMILTYS